LIGDDLGRFHDVLKEVGGGVATSGASEVGADASAFARHAVATGTGRGGVEFLSAGEVSAGLALGDFGNAFRDGPRASGSKGGLDVGHGSGRGAGELVERGFFGVGRDVGERFLADVFDEFLQAIAALPFIGFGEPGEVGLAESWSPTGFGIPEKEEVAVLLEIGAALVNFAGSAGVSRVPVEDAFVDERDVFVFGGGHELQGFGNDRGVTEIDEELGEIAIHRIVLGREERGKALDESGFVLRLPEADEGEGVGAEPAEELVPGERLGVEGAEFLENCGLVWGFTDTGEGDHSFDDPPRGSPGEGLICPFGSGLAFEGDAGGVADEAVGVAEVGKGFGDDFRSGATFVKFFEVVAELGLDGDGKGLHGRSGFLAGVGDAVEGGLGAAAPDHEIHRAIGGVNDDVGEGEGTSAHEFFHFASETAAVGDEMDGIHCAVGPVVEVEGALIFGGELGSGADGNSGGAAGADVGGRGGAVGIVVGPLAGTRAPAGFEPADHVVDAGGAIPGRAEVPLHVGIEGEEFAVLVEGGIEFIAEAGADHFDLPGIGIGLEDEAAGGETTFGVAVGIPHAGEEVVLGPGKGRAGVVDFFGRVGVVAEDEVEGFSVRAGDDAVEPMLAAAIEFAEQFFFIKLTVIVGVAEAVEAIGAFLFVLEDVE